MKRGEERLIIAMIIDSQGRILIRVSTPGSEFNHSSKGVGGVEYGHSDGGDEVDVG